MEQVSEKWALSQHDNCGMPYYVSNLGRLRRGSGEPFTTVFARGHSLINRSVARMVAEAFVPNPAGYRCIRHINGDNHDNRAANLEWIAHHGGNSAAKCASGEQPQAGYVVCPICGALDNDAPIRRSFCLDCWCVILGHLLHGTELPVHISPMFSNEAVAYAEKASMSLLMALAQNKMEVFA